MAQKNKPGKIILIVCLSVVGGLVFLYLCLTLITYLSFRKIKAEERKATDTTASIETVDPTDYSRYGNSDKVAFVINCENEGPYNWGKDYWKHTQYVIHYNGDLEIIRKYSISPETKTVKKLNIMDFEEIRFLVEDYEINESRYDKDYSTTYGGCMWAFYSYDLDGKKTFIYSGYIYGQTELENIEKILDGYGEQRKQDDGSN